MGIKLSEILGSLSQALDMTEGQLRGHSKRTAYIALKIARELSLKDSEILELYKAAILKDAGCSSNAARVYQIFNNNDLITKYNVKFIDWSDFLESSKFALKFVKRSNFLQKVFHLYKETGLSPKIMDDLTLTRCTNGSKIATYIGFSSEVAKAIECLDEHWDGNGSPYKLRGEDIPLFSRILCLSQTMEIFASSAGIEQAYEIAKKRNKKWFDPNLVDIAFKFKDDKEFWEIYKKMLNNPSLNINLGIENIEEKLTVDDVDRICQAFAMIIDAKSNYTYEHSSRVAKYSVAISKKMGFDEEKIKFIYRAGLLHDIGKLGIPSSIIDKPGKLTNEEFEIIKLHTKYTYEILSCIEDFKELADIASAHHEKLNGKGYHRKLKDQEIKVESRILAVADVFDALHSERPYRPAMPIEKVFKIMQEEMKEELDQNIVLTLKEIIQ